MNAVQIVGLPETRTDSPVDGMSAEAFEKRLEALVVNVEVADEAEQEGFVIGKIEDPLVVFDPLTAFYDEYRWM